MAFHDVLLCSEHLLARNAESHAAQNKYAEWTDKTGIKRNCTKGVYARNAIAGLNYGSVIATPMRRD